MAIEQIPERWVEQAANQTLERYLDRYGENSALAAPAVADLVKRRPEC